jgi:hypothetical protein
MTRHERLPGSEDSPALAPGLERFVAAARAQPIVGTCVTAEAVSAGLEHQRRRDQSRRTIALTAVLAIAATFVGVASLGPLLADEQDPRGVFEHPSAQLDPFAEPWTAPGPTIPPPPVPTLAQAVRLRSSAAVEVRGPWAIALREGTHEIELDPGADQALMIVLPERSLELVEGRVHVEFRAGAEPGDASLAAVRLETGVAAWVGADGVRTQIRVDRIDLDGSTKPASKPSTSAAELAREAEDLLAAGKREQAIATYQKLVRKHPRAPQTRGALLDLARLLRAAGREDEARCAYRLFLDRWPDSSVRAEVEAQLARLGPGPACRPS